MKSGETDFDNLESTIFRRGDLVRLRKGIAEPNVWSSVGDLRARKPLCIFTSQSFALVLDFELPRGRTVYYVKVCIGDHVGYVSQSFLDLANSCNPEGN